MRTLLFISLFMLALSGGKTVEARFADAFNYWQRSRPVNGTISVQEVKAWQRAKSAWRELEKVADRYYRGER